MVKFYIGEYHSDWLSESPDGDTFPNLQKWTTKMAAWEKRVHVTHLVEKAYDRACKEYDFERNATKLGMLLTADGSGDDQLKIQGLADYTFDASHASSSTGEEEEEEESDVEKEEADAEERGGGEAADDEKSAEETDDDEEDDTAAEDEAAAAAVTVAMAPEGFKIATAAPPMETREEEQGLIGKIVLFKWDGAPLEAGEFGWYRGTVAKRATEPQIKATAGVNFQVRFVNSETGGTLPFRIIPKSFTGKKKFAFVPVGLTKDVWGANGKWVVLEKV